MEFLGKELLRIVGSYAEEDIMYKIGTVEDLQLFKKFSLNPRWGSSFALQYASLKGDVEVVRQMIDMNADVGAQDNRALRSASAHGHTEVVKLLFLKGADLQAVQNDAIKEASTSGKIDTVQFLIGVGSSCDGALERASEYGHIDIVKLLLQISWMRHDLDRSMVVAASKGHLDIVEYLVVRGAYIRAFNNSAVKKAANGDHVEVLKYLADRGARIIDTDIFLGAVNYGSVKVVRFLIEKGVDVKADNNRALKEASFCGRLDIVKMLVAAGCPAQAAMETACSNSHLDVIKWLVDENGCNFKVQDEGRSFLRATLNTAIRIDFLELVMYLGSKIRYVFKLVSDDALFAVCQVGNLNMIEYLISHDVDFRVTINNETLYRALRFGRMDVVRQLESRGAVLQPSNDRYEDVIIDLSGNGQLECLKYMVEKHHFGIPDKALVAAAQGKHLEVIQYLVQRGANPRVFKDRALRHACEFGSYDVVFYLLSLGCDVQSVDNYSLRWAVRKGCLKTVQLLISRGANVHARREQALRRAIVADDLEIVKCLVEAGADIHSNQDVAVYLAMRHQCKGIVLYLLEKGADVTHWSYHDAIKTNH